MARIRSVHPDICQSEAMAGISPSGERTFVRLWTHCDDEGRCLNNPKLIRAALYPLHDGMTVGKVEGDLDELEDAGLIVRYVADGKSYLAVKSWDEYQHPQRPRPSKYPSPLDASAMPRVQVADVSGTGVERERERERETGEGVDDARSPLAENFAVFWSHYPRKVGKAAAAKAYAKALKGGATPDAILAALERVCRDWVRNDAQFIPHPTTWLNRGGWDDESLADLEHDRQAIAQKVAYAELGINDPWADENNVIALEGR